MKVFHLTLLTFTILFTQIESVNAAYNPFEPDVIKLTNTLDGDVNQAAATQFNNFDTTAVFNTDADTRVFTSITTNGVVAVPGVYMVDIVLYYEEQRSNVNVGVQVTVDGTSTGIIGANGFIEDDNDHEECTTSIGDLVRLTTASKIGFTTQRMGRNDNDTTAPAGESAITITRVDDI